MIETITRWWNKLYTWVISIFKFDYISEEGERLPEHFYDIYYHFKLLEREGKIRAIVSNLYLDNSFEIKILNSENIFKIYKVEDTVYSDLYSGDTIHIKKRIHKTFDSIENDIVFTVLVDDLNIFTVSP